MQIQFKAPNNHPYILEHMNHEKKQLDLLVSEFLTSMHLGGKLMQHRDINLKKKNDSIE
jgi:hypothetical protein